MTSSEQERFAVTSEKLSSSLRNYVDNLDENEKSVESKDENVERKWEEEEEDGSSTNQSLVPNTCRLFALCHDAITEVHRVGDSLEHSERMQQMVCSEMQKLSTSMISEMRLLRHAIQGESRTHSIQWAMNNVQIGSFDYVELEDYKAQFTRLVVKNSSVFVLSVLQYFNQNLACFISGRYLLPSTVASVDFMAQYHRREDLVQFERGFEERIIQQVFALTGLQPKVILHQESGEKAIASI